MICRWYGKWPSLEESIVVGLGVTDIDAEFPIGVDARCNWHFPDLLSFDDEHGPMFIAAIVCWWRR